MGYINPLFARTHLTKILLDLEPHIVRADRAMIDTVITNLIDNALKYSDEDIEVTLKNGTVSVTDCGIGIDHNEIKNIKSKFYINS